jgi:hypothetical protein
VLVNSSKSILYKQARGAVHSSLEKPKLILSHGIEPDFLHILYLVIFFGCTMSNSATPSTSNATVPSILVVPISEMLTQANYPLWTAQVLPAIRAAQLDDLLTCADLPPEKEITSVVDNKLIKSRNSAYSVWVARDQAVLGYLLSTLTHETLQHVSRCSTSAQAWRMLADLYSS